VSDTSLLTAAAGVSTFLGRLGLLAYLYYDKDVRTAKGTIADIIGDKTSFTPKDVVAVLEKFTSEEARLQALEKLTSYGKSGAKLLYSRISERLGVMNSLDFLTPREVFKDCIRLSAIPSLAAVVVGCAAWVLLAAFGQSGAEEPRFALVVPFILSAIYGNVVIYNTRWKHQVKVFGGRWWFLLTGLAIAWSAGFVVLGTLVEFTLGEFGVIEKPRSLWEAGQFVLSAVAFALLFSLLPAKGVVRP